MNNFLDGHFSLSPLALAMLGLAWRSEETVAGMRNILVLVEERRDSFEKACRSQFCVA